MKMENYPSDFGNGRGRLRNNRSCTIAQLCNTAPVPSRCVVKPRQLCRPIQRQCLLHTSDPSPCGCFTEQSVARAFIFILLVIL